MKSASVAPQILDQLRRISTATLTSQLFKLGFRNTYLTGVKPLNPALREQCRGNLRNNVVHAQHWVHEDGPHPTLCVIHGFMGSPYLFNGLFFSLPWFYRSGYDVLLYTLPFHGARAR